MDDCLRGSVGDEDSSLGMGEDTLLPGEGESLWGELTDILRDRAGAMTTTGTKSDVILGKIIRGDFLPSPKG